MKKLSDYLGLYFEQPFWRDGSWHYHKQSTIDLYHRKLDPFFERFDCSPGELTRADVTGWFDELKKEYSNGHLSIIRKQLNALLGFCVREGAMQQNWVKYVERFPSTPEQIVVPEAHTVAAIYNICHDLSESDNPILRRDAAILICGIGGLRRSNVGAVKFSSVVKALANPHHDPLVGKFCVVPIQEGKAPMELVLIESDIPIVQRWIDVRPETVHDALFIGLNPNPNTNKGQYLQPVGQGALIHARRRVCKLAGTPLVTYQQLRRHMGSRSAEIEDPARSAMVLGHSKHSGDRVVRLHYHDPDRHRARVLAAQVRLEIRPKLSSTEPIVSQSVVPHLPHNPRLLA